MAAALAVFSFFVWWAGPAAAEETFPFQGQIVSDNVNVRAGQSANFEKVARLNAGDKVVVVEKNFSWYKVKLPAGAQCYVHSKYVKDLGDSVGEITVNRLNARAGADPKFSSLGQLSQGALVKIAAKEGDWYRIEPVEGMYGWVSEEFVKFASRDVPAAMAVERPIRNIYKKQQVARAESMRAGASVNIQGVMEDLGDKAVSENVRHRLSADDKKVYFLKGYRRVLDNFLNAKVRIEGKVQDDPQADQPVILVTKVNLVL